MPTLSGISSFATNAGNSDMTVNLESNTLILNTLSFKNLACDEIAADNMRAKDPNDANNYFNVGERLLEHINFVGLFNIGPNEVTLSGKPIFQAQEISGELATAAQPRITSVGTLQNLNMSGNASLVGTLSVNSAGGMGQYGTVTADDLSARRCVDAVQGMYGPVLTPDQPNITSVGSLTSLTMNGPLSMGSNQLRLGASTTSDGIRISGKDGGANFDGAAPGGPLIYGTSGGILGTTLAGVEKCALRWWSGGGVGIGTTATPSGILDVNGNTFIRGRLYAGGTMTNGTSLPQGSTTTWNFSGGTGETCFINKSGSGGGGFHWWNSTGDNTAFSTGQSLMATMTPGDGLVVPTNHIRSRRVYCRVVTTNANFTPNNNQISLWDNANGGGGTTIQADLRPPAFNVGGMTGGTYRVDVAGHWKITVTVRMQDGAGGTKGVMLRRWNGATLSNILPADGVFWVGDDGAGRRCATVTATTQCAALEMLYASVSNTGQTVVWATMEVELVSLL